jgi:hypothetical protein
METAAMPPVWMTSRSTPPYNCKMRGLAENSVHHRHGGIEQTELARQAWLSWVLALRDREVNDGVGLPPEPGISVLIFILEGCGRRW